MSRCRMALLVLAVLAALSAGCGDGSQVALPTRSPEAEPSATNAASSPAATVTRLAIINATLIDGDGAPPAANSAVLVEDGRISQVFRGPSTVRLDGYETIDARGATLMPGLGDGHVHVSSEFTKGGPTELSLNQDGLVPFLNAGFTLLRDVGTAPEIFPPIGYFVDGLAREQKAPRVVWAGPILTTVGGYPISNPRYAVSGQEVKSADEAREWVNRLADGGARIIKLGLEKGYYADEGWPLMSLEEVRAVTETAHSRGLLVTAHVTSLDELRLAIDGGADDLAHAPLESIPDAMIQEMLSSGMGMVTTATIWGPAQWAAENARRYAEAGGNVAIGTDFGCCEQQPGIEAYLEELRFLQQAGMTPMQLLTAATRNVALLANAGTETGVIQPGKRADMILVDGDPLVDIGALRDVSMVILDGRVVFEREALSAPR